MCWVTFKVATDNIFIVFYFMCFLSLSLIAFFFFLSGVSLIYCCLGCSCESKIIKASIHRMSNRAPMLVFQKPHADHDTQPVIWVIRLTVFISFIFHGQYVVVIHVSELINICSPVTDVIWYTSMEEYCQHITNYYYYYLLIRVFHIRVSWWSFTGDWVTASLLKSLGLFSVFWPFSIMLLFGWSPLGCRLPNPPGPFIILELTCPKHQSQLVYLSPPCSIVFSIPLQSRGILLCTFFQIYCGQPGQQSRQFCKSHFFLLIVIMSGLQV